MTKRKSTITPFEEAHFRFGLIAPVIQNVYPDSSARAYYRRVTEKPILCPDGIARDYKPATLEKWTTLYRAKGIDGLTPEARSDKGTTRVLNDTATEEIYRIREKYPRITGVMIHSLLIQEGFIKADVSKRAVQRFIKVNDLKSARNPNVKDRKAFETPEFGCLWQSDDGVSYDCPQQFIGANVEIRYLPDHMEDAYILYEGVHYPIHTTDKVANSKTRRNNPALRIHYPEESAS